MIQESIEGRAEIEIPPNPFPGLRPFEFNESHLFFGREDQSENLIEKLSLTRFLALVGTSGSGKSSLVRAGLLPALIGGMMSEAGSAWRVALMRPGNNPIGKLAQALNSRDAFGSENEENRDLQIAITEATLRCGSLGLLEAVRQMNMPPSENLIVIADQFEELFRVEPGANKEGAENDKAGFVKLLLAASHQSEVNIYVVLTMRSDYLGDCSQFWDLPEAINEGQYLIPRMTVDQRREAITGPVEVGGADITPRLVNRLINDVGDNPDQLPILQHAMMRTWDEWKKNHEPDEPVDLRHYEAIGSMSEALSKHADEAYNELTVEHQKVAEKIFKALTEKGADNREVRRQMPVSEICEVVDAKEPDIIAVIDTFRSEGRSFLTPRISRQLDADSLIDISHESLIRIWKRLAKWVDEEVQSSRQYQRLAETSRLYEEGKEGLLNDPGLQVALDWRENNKPNPAWARRYHPDLRSDLAGLDASQKQICTEKAFGKVLSFLDESEKQRAASRTKHRLSIAALILLSLVAVAAAVFALVQKNIAESTTKTVRQLLYVSDMNLTQEAFDKNDRKRGYDLLNNYLPVPDASLNDIRCFDWYYLWRLANNESTTLNGHSASVQSVAFSPDSKVLASGSADNTIKLWDVASGKLLNSLQGHSDAVLSVAFSPNGRVLASGADSTIKLWDVASGKLLNSLQGHSDAVLSVAFSPNGRVLASGADSTIKLWDVASGKLLNSLQGHSDAVLSVAFSPDGRLLASSGADSTIKLWDVASGKLLTPLEGHSYSVSSVAFSPDGRLLASSGADSTIKLWDVASGKLLTPLEGRSYSVSSVAFSPDGRLLASGADNTIKLWDVASGKSLNSLQGHSAYVYSVAFSPDGKVLASGSADNTIKLWDVTSSKLLNSLQGHSDAVSEVAFSPDGKTLASGSADRTIKLWDVASGKSLNSLQGHSAYVYSVAFSPDGKVLASGSADNTIKLWDVASGKLLTPLEGHSYSVSSVAFSPDGRLLASSGADSTIKLWDVASGKLLTSLEGRSYSVLSVAFSPDGRLLASGADNTIKLWDVASGKLLNSLQSHSDAVYSVAFSPDGKVIASGSRDKTIKLWDVASGKSLNSLQGHSDAVSSVAFSPDGKVLASGSADSTIKLWDVASGKSLNSLQSHSAYVYSVAFSPDGKVLASGSRDKTIKLFFAATDQEVAAQRGN